MSRNPTNSNSPRYPFPVTDNRRLSLGRFLSQKSIISGMKSYFHYLRPSFESNWKFWMSQPSWTLNTSTRNQLAITSPASSSVVFVLLCLLWYSVSALASNTGKAILIQFRYPITLTFVQFAFVALYCSLFMTPFIRFSTMRAPTKSIIFTTFPMGTFQVVGHVFSSIAMSRIPVSTVHTIKALSPLFTVAAYALLFGVRYSKKTYISLLPLTIGVMLACSFDTSVSNLIGVFSAFGSAVVFVSQNIFFKKVMPATTGASSPGLDVCHKLDKLNLLLYSSTVAFLLMLPLWLYYDLPIFIAATANPLYIKHPKSGHDTPHSMAYYFIMNGIVNFAQNIIAFVILSSTSPVTYSIASLIKRVVVICIAIIWFNQTVHPVQAFGILMTFTGLYMYNYSKADVEIGEKKMRMVAAERDLVLPIVNVNSGLMSSSRCEVVESTGLGLGSAQPRTGIVTTMTSHHRYLVTKPPKHYPKIHSYPSPPLSVDSPTSNFVPIPIDVIL